jgi:predicted acyl esterase
MKAEVKKFDGMVVCDESITVRDGTVLAARVYRPSTTPTTYPIALFFHGMKLGPLSGM